MTNDTDTETNRDRVRRLVVTPLQNKGMRYPKAVIRDDAVKALDAVCDALAFASDRTLAAVCAWAACNGEGSQRCFFPALISFVSVAEAYQPRDLEEVPAVASWFRSRAGEEARREGRLVAEFLFFEKKKRPPLHDAERKTILDKAAQWARDLHLHNDRIDRGVEPGVSSRQFVAYYRRVEQRADALVDAGIQSRAAAAVGKGDAA